MSSSKSSDTGGPSVMDTGVPCTAEQVRSGAGRCSAFDRRQPGTDLLQTFLSGVSRAVPFDASIYGSYTFVHESHEPRPTAATAWQRLREIFRARQELVQIELQLEQLRRKVSSLPTQGPSSASADQGERSLTSTRTPYAQLHRLLVERERLCRALSTCPATLRDDTQVLSGSLEAIQFEVPSVDDIRRASVIEITRKQLYTAEHDVVPHGALDKHLGISDKNDRCATCGCSLAECAGHFGHIELVLPVFHVGYLGYLLQILQCICKRCSRLLVEEQVVDSLHRQQRRRREREIPGHLQALLKRHMEWAKRSVICRHCGAPNGLVRKVTSGREWLASNATTSAAITRDSIGTGSRAVGGQRRNSSTSTGAPRLVHELTPRAGWSQRQWHQLQRYLSRWYERLSNASGKPVPMTLSRERAWRFDQEAIFGVEGDDPDATLAKIPRASTEFTKQTGPKTIDGAVSSRERRARYALELTPLHVLELLRNMTPFDIEALGMNPEGCRPEDLLLRCVAVPPVCIRPSVCSDPSQGSTEDDLTVMLADIAGANTLVLEQLVKGADLGKLMDAWDHLQLAVARYIHAEYPGLPSGLYYKAQIGLCQRLKGKQGRFRGNLSGKRVDFSARTVISPDPNLSIDQVGVPLRIAKVLTYPERVTPFNLDRLRASILRGPDRHPGANYVLFPDGSKRFLRFGDREEIARGLLPGCTVERHIIDGDIVLFNRQPSLHRLSIMAHRVKVIAGRTFRFNECVCAPYNADFDGDEMNLHVPQTEEARAEAMELLAVCNNLLSPRNGEPLIACTQDFITALYLLTHKDVFYGRQAAAQCLVWALEPQTPALFQPRLPEPAVLHPEPLWTGKQLFSSIVQADELLVNAEIRALICCDAAEKGYTGDGCWCPADAYVCVRSAELVCGQVAKRTVGAQSKNALFYVLHREAGPMVAARCMNRLARFASRWLSEYGFSFGIDEVRPSVALEQAKAERIHDAYRQVQSAIDRYRQGAMRPRPGCTDEETLEWHIHRLLSDLREQAGQLCLQDMAPENAAMIMAMSGAKGSTINISQMVACVGQQTVNGTRVRSGFQQRTLPHFPRGDKSPEAGGFVANSFYSGMNAIEFFFHSMAGREGLVDTAVKTAETGYMQRRFMKALEDLRVAYDGTVRTSNAGVVQFRYGGDGLDPLEMEAMHGQAIDWERLWNTIQWLDAHEAIALGARVLPPATRCEAPGVRDAGPSMIPTSVLTQSHPLTMGNNERNKTSTDRLASDVIPLPSSWPERVREAAAESIASRGPIHDRQWQRFMLLVERKLQRASIQPGTAVGAIAAQSIGEPSTQMTLKTFHFAGVASMNITQGVPRIKELVNATRHISTPLVTAALEKVPNGSTLELARAVRTRLECRRLGQVVRYGEIRWQRQDAYLDYVLDEGFAREQGLLASVNKALKPEDAVEVPLLRRLRAQLHWPTPDPTQRPTSSSALRIRWEVDGTVHLQVWPTAATDCGTRSASRSSLFSDRRASSQDIERELSQLQRRLPELVVSGLPSIRRVVLSQLASSAGDPDVSSPDHASSIQLLAESEDMRSIMNTEGVDPTRVFCNHVLVVERILGIEAARTTMVKEILETMAAHGVTVDARHVNLLADMMTFGGEVLGITRFGIGKMRQSTLMLASFEKTVDHLFEAALRTRSDRIQGVSERVIMGRPVPLGTGMVSVGLSEEACGQRTIEEHRKHVHPGGPRPVATTTNGNDKGIDHEQRSEERAGSTLQGQRARLVWHRERPPGSQLVDETCSGDRAPCVR